MHCALLISASLGVGTPAVSDSSGSTPTKPPWMTAEAPFVWDAGDASDDGSLACAVLDCENYVASMRSADETCVGESRAIMNPDAIVVDECLSDGSRVHAVIYGSSADETLYQPDGGECLAILGNQFQDPAVQTLASFDSTGTLTCGGLTLAGLCRDGRTRRSLTFLGALTCLPQVPPCPP
jgi:hypothetical protein